MRMDFWRAWGLDRAGRRTGNRRRQADLKVRLYDSVVRPYEQADLKVCLYDHVVRLYARSPSRGAGTVCLSARAAFGPANRAPMLSLAAALLVVITAAVSLHGQPLPTLSPLDASGRVTYFIAEGLPGSDYRRDDRDLARFALAAWERSIGGALEFEEVDEEDEALVRVRWVPASSGQYGEMRPLLVKGRRGAEVFIRPDVTALGPDISQLARTDPLLRDTIVYLTCVHELGHALGLSHTADFADIMYFFGYGGDIPRFFGRYREQLRSRADIAKYSGLSPSDVSRVRALYTTR